MKTELTEREKEVLLLIAMGATTKEIAVRLSIAVKTVEKHRQNLMNKLDIHNAVLLTHYALANKLIPNHYAIQTTRPS